ncbi:UNKNOWN [Stylonychia lemnae]|uniref:Uncharacterized protein n=1 Tax=Stylonychia lemnae TaxID=5949 RepID=A0A078AYF5_STYLE|nr:UNKNOWN [Stylonychia lemnae]|eukprot:CDW87166.1 UNKNOWN [Stylonychia lemnae]
MVSNNYQQVINQQYDPLSEQESLMLSELLLRSSQNQQQQQYYHQSQNKQNGSQHNLTSSSIFLLPNHTNSNNPFNDKSFTNYSITQQWQSYFVNLYLATVQALKALQDKVKELETENMALKHQKVQEQSQNVNMLYQQNYQLKEQLTLLRQQLKLVEDEKKRHLEMNSIREEINQTKQNIQQIEMVIQQMAQKNENDLQNHKIKIAQQHEENVQIKKKYDQLKRQYQKDVHKQQIIKQENQDYQKLKLKMKEIKQENIELNLSLKYLQEELRSYHQIYGKNFIKIREQSLKASHNSLKKEKTIDRQTRRLSNNNSTSKKDPLARSQSVQKLNKQSQLIVVPKQHIQKSFIRNSSSQSKSLKRNSSQTKRFQQNTITINRHKSSQKKALNFDKPDNFVLESVRLNQLSTGYSPVNVPQVLPLLESQTLEDEPTISHEPRYEYFQHINDNNLQHSSKKILNKLQNMSHSSLILHPTFMESDLNYNQKQMQDLSFSQIKSDITQLVETLSSKEELLSNLKSKQISQNLYKRNQKRNSNNGDGYILVGESVNQIGQDISRIQTNQSASVLSSSFRANN